MAKIALALAARGTDEEAFKAWEQERWALRIRSNGDRAKNC